MILALIYVLYPNLLLQVIIDFGDKEMSSDIEQESKVQVKKYIGKGKEYRQGANKC